MSFQVNGDFTIETAFDRRVRFSGVFFWIPEGYSSIIVSQGEKANWTNNPVGLGLLRPALDDPWDDLGMIEALVEEPGGKIQIRLVFAGEQLQVYINDRMIATRTNQIFSGVKSFGGFDVGNGDGFGIEGIRVWANSASQLEW